MATPDTILYNTGLGAVASGAILVTPTGGAQTALADALATATGGAVSATTLSASSTVTLSPANKNVVIAPSGTGVATIAPATAGTMDNMAVGGSTPLAGHFTTLNASGVAAFAGTTTIASAAPANAGSAGVAGQITWASGFLYVCVATNTWQRAAIATW